MSLDDKKKLNDLLSRLDTLHDFCDPSPDTTRNKDLLINQKDRVAISEEFANVFKPEILKALDNEPNVRDISKKELIKNINSLIDKYIAAPLRTYYKSDVDNLIDRTKNGLILVNYLKTNGKEVFSKSDRLGNFEPTVVAFYEFLYNTIFQKEQGIGKFVANMQLPIFDYVNSEYKVLDNGEYKKIQINPSQKNIYIPTTDINMQSFIQTCTTNKESIISFILGTINDSDSGEIFLSTEDTSGFYKFPADNKSSIKIPRKKNRNALDQKILSELYFRYLSDIRAILGQYFNRDNNAMIYLIVDTTNISFSKYYKELTAEQRSKLKLMVLCNVAMSWDGATSPECQPKDRDSGQDKIVHTKKDDNRAIYDIESLSLQERSGSTLVKFDSDKEIDYKPVPREVGQLAECIRQQISPRRQQTKECKSFKTKARLLDIKRSGDALQALMAKKLNEENPDPSELYIFVTLDHLAFLKARLNGIPSIFTSTMKEKNSKIRNRVMVLFNNTFEKNYKAMSLQLQKEFTQFKKIKNVIDDNFPIIYFADTMQKEKETEAYFRFYLMLDYLCRSMFGLILYVRPKSLPNDVVKWLKTPTYEGETLESANFITDVDDTQDIIKKNLQVLLQDYIVQEKLTNNTKFQYYQPYVENSIYKQLQNKINTSTESLINSLNDKINKVKEELVKIAHEHNQMQFILSSDVGLIDLNKIKSILEQFILNTFIIECFYTIKRCGIFSQYLDDSTIIEMMKINDENVSKMIRILNTEPMQDQETATAVSNNIEFLKSINKKYITYTSDSSIEILADFFSDYTYANDEQFKNKLKILFDMNYNEYIEFVDSLLGEFEVIFEDIMKTRINFYLNKFKSNDYFDEPARPTRTMLRVRDKMAECMNQFNLPSMLQRTYQDLLYSRIHNNAEGFYKSKMAELHLGNITNKSISFEKAMSKIIDDEIKLRNREIQKGGDDSQQDGSQRDGSQRDESERDRSQNGGGFKELLAYRNLLLSNFIYDPELYSGIYPFTDQDFMNVELFKKYNLFLMDIYSRYDEYLPKYYEIDQEIFDNIVTDWFSSKYQSSAKEQYQNGKLNLNYLILIWYKQLYSTDSLSDEQIENLNNYPTKNIPNFTYDLISVLLQKTVDSLYTIIEDVYNKKITLFSKDQDSRLDMVLWMMINDPAMLLYHPNRKPEWAAHEMVLINSAVRKDAILMKEKRLIYNGGVLYAKRYPLESIVAELVYRSSNKYNPKLLGVKKGKIEKDVRRPRYDDKENYYKENYKEYYNENKVVDREKNALEVIQENLNQDQIKYNEYFTLDEYATIKSIFQRTDKYLLKTNLGILAFLDPKTGIIREDYGNFYSPSKMLKEKQILPNGKHFYNDILTVQGGGKKDIFNEFKTLADYHKKFYPKYYELYYSTK